MPVLSQDHTCWLGALLAGGSVALLPLGGWEQQLPGGFAGRGVALLIFRQAARCFSLRCCLCGSTGEIHMEQHTRGSHPLAGRRKLFSHTASGLAAATKRRERFASQQRKVYLKYKETSSLMTRQPHS